MANLNLKASISPAFARMGRINQNINPTINKSFYRMANANLKTTISPAFAKMANLNLNSTINSSFARMSRINQNINPTINKSFYRMTNANLKTNISPAFAKMANLNLNSSISPAFAKMGNLNLNSNLNPAFARMGKRDIRTSVTLSPIFARIASSPKIISRNVRSSFAKIERLDRNLFYPSINHSYRRLAKISSRISGFVNPKVIRPSNAIVQLKNTRRMGRSVKVEPTVRMPLQRIGSKTPAIIRYEYNNMKNYNYSHNNTPKRQPKFKGNIHKIDSKFKFILPMDMNILIGPVKVLPDYNPTLLLTKIKTSEPNNSANILKNLDGAFAINNAYRITQINTDIAANTPGTIFPEIFLSKNKSHSNDTYLGFI